MKVIDRRILDLDINELRGVDEVFFKSIQMDKERALKRFSVQISEARKLIEDNVSIQGIAESFVINSIEEDTVIVDGGYSLSSGRLAEAFKNSEHVVIYTVAVHGYDKLETGETDMRKLLLMDGWGTAITECAYALARKKMQAELLDKGLYSTFAWSPGQHNVDIALQRPLFRLLKPETIGMKLNKSCVMFPKKSQSGFFGVGTVEDVVNYRPCDFCEYSSTCPGAYASSECY